jgi:phage baseplate assembly protein W
MTNFDVPYRFDAHGDTAQPADLDAHVQNLVREVLLVSPGERVNRPTFGCKLLNLAFAGNSAELAAAVRLSTQAELLRWLGDLIEVRAVDAVADGVVLRVTVSYRIRLTGAQGTAQGERPVPQGAGA